MSETPAQVTSPPQPLADAIDGRLVCREITEVTHDVKSFVFEPSDGASLRFRAGQYLVFRCDVADAVLERCYTISSPPTRPARLSITVKRVPGGPVSNWLHDRLRIGDTLRARGPLGRFSHTLHPAERYLFLSAGSGITPLMSMLRTIRDSADPSDVAFVHCARSPLDIIFRSELEAMAAYPDVTMAAVTETDVPGAPWHGHRGRLTLPTLLMLAPDLLDREVFTCGPPGFMSAVREMLALLGLDAGRCHEESFDLGGASQHEQTDASVIPRRVEFRRSGHVVECDENTPLLEAAAREGLTLPSSCGEGVCGTCKTSLLSGRVDMRHSGGIRPREEAEGKILLCCSTPREDLVIDA